MGYPIKSGQQCHHIDFRFPDSQCLPGSIPEHRRNSIIVVIDLYIVIVFLLRGVLGTDDTDDAKFVKKVQGARQISAGEALSLTVDRGSFQT